jgi:flagellin
MAETVGSVRGGSPRSIDTAQRDLQKSLAKLSSARRIDRAADDAAGLAISENLQAAVRSFRQGERNLSDGLSVARTAEGGLTEASEIVSRLRELSIQAQNGTVGEEGRAAIQNEFDQLTSELTRIAQTTRFNGRNLLNGESSGTDAITVRDGTDTSEDAVEISIDDVTAAGLGVDGLSASDGATLAQLDQALTTLSSTRASVGAAESRLSAGIANLRSVEENTEAARSRIQDTDFAATTAEKTRSQILLQSSVATQAQANISASAALSLLR